MHKILQILHFHTSSTVASYQSPVQYKMRFVAAVAMKKMAAAMAAASLPFGIEMMLLLLL
jgi:hypothetical protein